MNNIQQQTSKLTPNDQPETAGNPVNSIRDVDKIEKKLGRSRDTLMARGAVFFNLKQYEKSKYYFCLAAKRGYDTAILTCLLKSHSKLQNMEETEEYFLEAQDTLSENPVFWQLWGYVKMELKQFEDASNKFLNAKNNNFPDKNLNMEFLLKALNNCDMDEKVIFYAEEAIENGFKDLFVIECYVSALMGSDKFQKAYDLLEKCSIDWDKSARLNAFYAVCVNVLFQDNEKAIYYNEKAHRMEPDNIQIRWNLSLVQLRAGRIKDGIENYKVRFQWAKFPSPRRTFDVPQWDETVDKNARILVWTEQGIADDLLFCTALSDFKYDFPNIIFEHHNKTGDLMSVSFPDVKCREAFFKPDLSPILFDYDFHVPLGDLYLRMLAKNISIFEQGKTLTNKHYLKVDELRKKYWGFKLPDDGKPKIGFAWTSKKLDGGRHRHHTELKDWTVILERDDVHFVSLQYNFDFEDLSALGDNYSKYFFDTGYLDQLDDLEGAVALMSNLDLVITSGSAPYIMSAALGKETWVYGSSSPWTLGRTTNFSSHPILPNLKGYVTGNALHDENLIPSFSSKLDQFVADFYRF